jgi:hypothetical protein
MTVDGPSLHSWTVVVTCNANVKIAITSRMSW